MRYAAPADVSAISLSCGEFAVTKGHVDLPDELNAGDLAGLAATGFTSAPTKADEKKADADRAKADEKD